VSLVSRSFYIYLSCSEFRSWEKGLHRIVVKLQQALAWELIDEKHLLLRMLEQGLDRAMRAHRRSKPLEWDPVVRSFWECVLFYCRQRGVRLIQGPGLHDKVKRGKGFDRTQFRFAQTNLPGPSLSSLRRGLPASTTIPGLVRDLVVSACKILGDPARKDTALVHNNTVSVFPVAIASDGFSIKPGLQVDKRSGTVVGLSSGSVDLKSIQSNPVLDSSTFKLEVTTDIVQLHLVSMLCDLSLPVGSLFKPKSKTGQQWMADFTEIVCHIATCVHCLNASEVQEHVLVGDMQCTTTSCSACVQANTVCDQCKAQGHTQVDVSLRACDPCITANRFCRRLTCLVLPADCESYQSTGMDMWVERQKDNSDNSLRSLAVPAPEEVHIGKRIRAALKNYWLTISGQRINLRVLWVLRNEGSARTQQQWQRLLPQSAVVGKDNMDVSSMLQVSAPGVVKQLGEHKAIVIETVPDRKSFWTGNRPGVVKSPTSICTADLGFVAFTDIERGALLVSDNHCPANVSVLVQQLDRPDCVTYGNGLLMFAETGKRKTLMCADLTNSHILAPDQMKAAQLRAACLSRDLDIKGNKADLIERLNKWLRDNQAADVHSPIVEMKTAEVVEETESVPWAKQRHKTRPAVPTYVVAVNGLDQKSSIRALLLHPTGKRLMLSTATDTSPPTILEVELQFHGRSVSGKIVKTIQLQAGNCASLYHLPCAGAVVRGLAWRGSELLFCDLAQNGGIFSMDLQNSSPSPIAIVRNGSINSSSVVRPHSIACDGQTLYVSDLARRQLLQFADGKVSVLCGSGNSGIVNGSAEDAAFHEPTGVCVDGSTLYVADAGGSIRLIVTDTAPLRTYLQHLHSLLVTFGVHLPSVPAEKHTLADAISCLSTVVSDFKTWNKAVNLMRGAPEHARVQGPQGALPTQIIHSVELLLKSIKSVQGIFLRVNPALVDKVRLEAFLTLAVEQFFSIMRSWNQTPNFQEFMHRQIVVAKEMIRRSTVSDFHVFTSPTSHYSPLDTQTVTVRFSDIQFPAKAKQHGPKLSASEKHALQQFAEQGRGLRQLTIRQQTTKSKAGALPPLAYAQRPTPGSLHEFSKSAIETVISKQVHPFNDSLLKGQWLGLLASALPEIDPAHGVLLLGTCLFDANNTQTDLHLALYAAQPQTPCVFAWLSESVVPKSAVFALIEQQSVRLISVEDQDWELDSDIRDELLNFISPDESTDTADSDDANVASAASGSSRRRRKRKTKSRKPRSRSKRLSRAELKQDSKDEQQGNTREPSQQLIDAVAADLLCRVDKMEPFVFLESLVTSMADIDQLQFDMERSQQTALVSAALDKLKVPHSKREVALQSDYIRDRCGVTLGLGQRVLEKPDYVAMAGKSSNSMSLSDDEGGSDDSDYESEDESDDAESVDNEDHGYESDQ
jgi:hypothetical protein